MNCSDCHKKKSGTCIKLCREAREYADQDYVPRQPQEVYLSTDYLDQINWSPEEDTSFLRVSRNISLSNREWQVVMLLILLKPEDFFERCSKYLKITKENAWKILQRVRERLVIKYN